MQTLVDMGFNRDAVLNALASTENDVNQATAILLSASWSNEIERDFAVALLVEDGMEGEWGVKSHSSISQSMDKVFCTVMSHFDWVHLHFDKVTKPFNSGELFW